jgi:hypothetical protein
MEGLAVTLSHAPIARLPAVWSECKNIHFVLALDVHVREREFLGK